MLYSMNMCSTPAVWKQYNKMAVLHLFSRKFLSIYSILYDCTVLSYLYVLQFCCLSQAMRWTTTTSIQSYQAETQIELDPIQASGIKTFYPCTVQTQHTLYSTEIAYTVQYRVSIHCTVQSQHTLYSTSSQHTLNSTELTYTVQYRVSVHCTVQSQHTLYITELTYTVQYRVNIHCTVQSQHTLYSTELTYTVQYSQHALYSAELASYPKRWRGLYKVYIVCLLIFSALNFVVVV